MLFTVFFFLLLETGPSPLLAAAFDSEVDGRRAPSEEMAGGALAGQDRQPALEVFR